MLNFPGKICIIGPRYYVLNSNFEFSVSFYATIALQNLQCTACEGVVICNRLKNELIDNLE